MNKKRHITELKKYKEILLYMREEQRKLEIGKKEIQNPKQKFLVR